MFFSESLKFFEYFNSTELANLCEKNAFFIGNQNDFLFKIELK